MVHQKFVEKFLKSFDYAHDRKSCLNYGELVLQIETCLSFDKSEMIDSIIYDPARGAAALSKLKDILVYLRDYKNEELKAMYTEECSVTAPILFYLLNITLKIRRIVFCFTMRYLQKSYRNKGYIYSYLCCLVDVVEVIAYRHLKLFLYKYNDFPDLKNYLAIIPEEDLQYMSRKRSEAKNVNIILQDKLGVDLEVSQLLKPDDNECAICGDSLDANSDFAVLDTCNHLMCTDCAEVTLMGEVVDLVPLGEESDDVEYGHLVELGKIPRCPCCRRQVGQWTTTHILKFCQVNKCKFWEGNTTSDLLLREPILLGDIVPNCVNECLLMNYSSTFVWMAVFYHIERLDKKQFIHQYDLSFVLHTIEMLLKLPRPDESSQKYGLDGIFMCFIQSSISSMVSNNKIEDNSYIRQLVRNIRSKFFNVD